MANDNVIDNIYGRMEEKARKNKDYHVKIWEEHIGQLVRMVHPEKEGGLTYERWLELKAELMGYAEASWSGNNEKA